MYHGCKFKQFIENSAIEWLFFVQSLSFLSDLLIKLLSKYNL